MKREEYLTYIKNYQQHRRGERRVYAVDKLGGKCTNCGTKDGLEFDHMIPIGQVIGRRISELLTANIKRLDKELELCQLLCGECHKLKSAFEDRQHSSMIHGTHGALKYCKPRCNICREFEKNYNSNRIGRRR